MTVDTLTVTVPVQTQAFFYIGATAIRDFDTQVDISLEYDMIVNFDM